MKFIANDSSWDIYDHELFLVTLVLGIVTIVVALLSIVVTFVLSFRDRGDRYQTEAKAKINLFLERTTLAFNELGVAIKQHDEVAIQQSLNLLDIFSKLTLDNLTPSIAESQQNVLQRHAYRTMLIKTFKSTLPIAIEHFQTALIVNRNSLIEAKKANSPDQAKALAERITKMEKMLSFKTQEAKSMKKASKKQIWDETLKELQGFRVTLNQVVSSLIDSYGQVQTKGGDKNWQNLANTYRQAQETYRDFRGTLESLFIGF
ncbi:hypothetical protein JN01_0630 [Entomoplasma freundtii]|uniref:Uncharacterized protein n=1 Tax=Entomoplasma freundtii TaxID=74700 RepID=A0A2K8NR60_9MOLU|nr:hypothetical protein [Entomoplasma freundtii]ATZ16330.1 hypothetical protein EFREU_v1c03040 [Entomoplasma freundtii]TDY56631.1 hypothetical protein JN01_0630 [Entomoplasma freundtii]